MTLSARERRTMAVGAEAHNHDAVGARAHDHDAVGANSPTMTPVLSPTIQHVTADRSVERARALYADALAEMAGRVDAARFFLDGPAEWPFARAAACELRGALELLVLSGLLTHRELIKRAETALSRANRKEARRIVRSVNRHWWPRPVVTYPDRIDWRTGDDWLLESEWDSYHSRTSNVLHMRNPFIADGPRLDTTSRWLAELASKLIALLTAHDVQYNDQSSLLGQISPPDHDPRVTVTVFARV